MTRLTLHMMTVDLPLSAGGLDGELEVDIAFTWHPVTGIATFVAAEPAQPFSGPYTEREYDRLQNTALEWFEKHGHERALKQIEVDKEDGL